MALFTDAQTITLDDLSPFEGSLVQVASSHDIDIDQKIALATRSVGETLLLLLKDTGLSDPQWLSRRVIGLSTLVITPLVHRWLCYESLSRFFAEAYNVQLNTRFEGKWTQYKQDARSAADQTLHAGLGIVYTPLPKPQLPEVSIQDGTSPAEPFFVQTSWMDSQGNEGTASPINGVVVGTQSGITVQMAEGVLQAPPAALGWNVYVGSAANHITRQNGNPLLIGSTWSLPASGLVDGPPASRGQKPDHIVPISRQIRRG
jgi:hypothetical protein